jgi:hypothetical protein
MKSATILVGLLLSASALAQGPNWIVDGPAIQGRIEATDSELGDDEHYDDHRIELRANQRVLLTLESDDFDPVLMVYRADDMHEPVAENDDGSEGFNSRLAFAAPADGTYVMRVLSYEPGTLGAYALRARALPPLPAPVTAHSGTATTIWRTFRGELGAQDPDNDGQRFDDYQVSLRQGEQLLLRLDAEGFDPVVQLLAADSRNGPVLEADDDSGPGANAMLGFDVPQSGDYIVRVTSFAAGQAGAYTLRVGN